MIQKKIFIAFNYPCLFTCYSMKKGEMPSASSRTTPLSFGWGYEIF